MLCSDCDKARHQEFLHLRKTMDCATQNDGTPQIVVNELLSYVAFYRNRASLRMYVSYSSVFTLRLKSTLLKRCQAAFGQLLSDCPLRVDRRKTATRVVCEVEVDDIIGIMDRLNRSAQLSLVTFAAVNHDRIPKYGPEELNICTIADRQADGHSCHNWSCHG